MAAAPALSLREQQRLQTRQRLMDAALELFGRQGYVHTAVEDVCAAIGARRATFYLHFKSKRDVLVARHEECRPEFIARYRQLDTAITSPNADVPTVVREWLSQWFDYWRENRPLLASLREASVVEPEILAELGDPYFLADAMTSYLKGLAPAARKKARQGIMLLEVMTAEAFDWILMQRDSPDVEASLDFLTDMWCDRLQSGSAPAKGSGGRLRRAAS